MGSSSVAPRRVWWPQPRATAVVPVEDFVAGGPHGGNAEIEGSSVAAAHRWPCSLLARSSGWFIDALCCFLLLACIICLSSLGRWQCNSPELGTLEDLNFHSSLAAALGAGLIKEAWTAMASLLEGRSAQSVRVELPDATATSLVMCSLLAPAALAQVLLAAGVDLVVLSPSAGALGPDQRHVPVVYFGEWTLTLLPMLALVGHWALQCPLSRLRRPLLASYCSLVLALLALVADTAAIRGTLALASCAAWLLVCQGLAAPVRRVTRQGSAALPGRGLRLALVALLLLAAGPFALAYLLAALGTASPAAERALYGALGAAAKLATGALLTALQLAERRHGLRRVAGDRDSAVEALAAALHHGFQFVLPCAVDSAGGYRILACSAGLPLGLERCELDELVGRPVEGESFQELLASDADVEAFEAHVEAELKEGEVQIHAPLLVCNLKTAKLETLRVSAFLCPLRRGGGADSDGPAEVLIALRIEGPRVDKEPQNSPGSPGGAAFGESGHSLLQRRISQGSIHSINSVIESIVEAEGENGEGSDSDREGSKDRPSLSGWVFPGVRVERQASLAGSACGPERRGTHHGTGTGELSLMCSSLTVRSDRSASKLGTGESICSFTSFLFSDQRRSTRKETADCSTLLRRQGSRPLKVAARSTAAQTDEAGIVAARRDMRSASTETETASSSTCEAACETPQFWMRSGLMCARCSRPPPMPSSSGGRGSARRTESSGKNASMVLHTKEAEGQPRKPEATPPPRPSEEADILEYYDEDDRGEEDGEEDGGRSPAGARFDGRWVLCEVPKGVSDWLRELTIHGDEVIDGEGRLVHLVRCRGEVTLEGGTLQRQGGFLYRVGKSGRTQKFAPAPLGSCDAYSCSMSTSTTLPNSSVREGAPSMPELTPEGTVWEDSMWSDTPDSSDYVLGRHSRSSGSQLPRTSSRSFSDVV